MLKKGPLWQGDRLNIFVKNPFLFVILEWLELTDYSDALFV